MKNGGFFSQLENLVDEIESELQQRSVREVNSFEIGELVLQNLRNLSEVAYIRFASVYRKFQGIRDFVDTLNHLQSTTNLQSATDQMHPAESTPPTPFPVSEESPANSDTTLLTSYQNPGR